MTTDQRVQVYPEIQIKGPPQPDSVQRPVKKITTTIVLDEHLRERFSKLDDATVAALVKRSLTLSGIHCELEDTKIEHATRGEVGDGS